jgi:hypothetical protein
MVAPGVSTGSQGPEFFALLFCGVTKQHFYNCWLLGHKRLGTRITVQYFSVVVLVYFYYSINVAGYKLMYFLYLAVVR